MDHTAEEGRTYIVGLYIIYFMRYNTYDEAIFDSYCAAAVGSKSLFSNY